MTRGPTARRTRRHAPSASPGAVEPLIVLAALLLLAACLFGGASRENPLRLAAVELTALPLGAVAMRRLIGGEGASRARDALWPLAILAATILLPVLQLIPLPPDLWSALPGQGPRREALVLVGLPPPWLPVSLQPAETGRAVLALAPPAAMFLGVLALGPGPARRLAGLWIVMAVAGLALGVAQIVAPGGGPAYLYRTTNLGRLVGLFANRNHEAAFLLALLPFAAALAIPARRSSQARQGGSGGGSDTAVGAPGVGPWLAGLFIVTAVVALGVIQSRAGVLLAGPAVAATLLVLARGGGRGGGWRPAAILAATIAVAVVAVALFGLGPILERFAPQDRTELRFEAWPHVARAAWAHLPLGSGVGSFARVFQTVEPLDLVVPTYFNHAHDEYLEIWLEAGWPGVALMGLFGLWLAFASARAWRSGEALARAASVAAFLLLAASLVDYPLRTETLAVLMAFCCALLAFRARAAP